MAKISNFNSFIFPEIIKITIDNLPTDELKLKYYTAVTEYGLFETEPTFTGLELSLWIGMKDYIDTSNEVNNNERNCPEYRLWRKSVFERDNYTCQMCGNKQAKLNAHHIKRFAKDIANRFNVANGITLCVDCHKYVHKVEGR